MTAYYSLSEVQGFAVTGLPVYEMVAASANQPKLMEIEFHLPVASGAFFNMAIGVPATPGIATASRPPIPEDYSTTNTPVAVRTAWSRLPTTPTNYYRRGIIFSQTNQAARLRWRFPRGLTIAPGTSLVAMSTSGATYGTIYTNMVFEA